MVHTVRIVRLPTQRPIFVSLDDKELTPTESYRLRNHSPDGFEAGYPGSGPAQLALAIMMEVLRDEEAQKYYERFKWKYLTNPVYQEVGTHEFTFITKKVKELAP